MRVGRFRIKCPSGLIDRGLRSDIGRTMRKNEDRRIVSAIHFGTDGWRAIIAETFTFDNVRLVTHAAARYMRSQYGTARPVVVGYDCRFLADRFAQCAAEALVSQGFTVLMTEGYTPTPIVAYAARAYESAGALMFTASHNPPEYMGVKFIPNYAGPATQEITDAIVATVRELEVSGLPAPQAQPGRIETFNPYERYVALLSKAVRFDALTARPLKILYDPMYGAGQGYLDRIYHEKTGLRLDMLHNSFDARFGGQLPEPKAECLPELMARVPAEGYDLGIANDGDADRFGVIDETGRFLGADVVLPLLFRYLYHRRGFRGSVARTIATSTLMDALAAKVGVTVHETKVGFKHIGEVMRREDVIIGGEESGGLSVLGHIPEKDGILGDLLMAEMIAVEGKPLSAIVADLEAEAGIRLFGINTNLHLDDAQKQGLMDAMRALKPGDAFAGRPIQEIITRDGVKLLFGPSDWVLVRPSGTEPILRLYGESPDPVMRERFEADVAQRIAALSGSGVACAGSR